MEFFYNFCEKCHYRTNYHQCDHFRGFLLVLAVFFESSERKCRFGNAPELEYQKKYQFILCVAKD